MSAFRVFVTQKASDDLSAAVRYITFSLSNASAARQLLDSFDELVGKLESFAPTYPFVRDEIAASAGYRWAEFGNYMVFFRVDEQSSVVCIDRISYKKRNWTALIR